MTIARRAMIASMATMIAGWAGAAWADSFPVVFANQTNFTRYVYVTPMNFYTLLPNQRQGQMFTGSQRVAVCSRRQYSPADCVFVVVNASRVVNIDF